jgi:glycosyltransferase involved in cell wall biosynthesis
MKILMVNWSWYPTGGDWTYIDNLKRLYEDKGHQVIALSTQNPLNVPSTENDYFIESNNFKDLNKNKNFANSVRVIKNSIVSSAALKQIDLILEKHNIKLAHFHNIHHYITPSIIWRLKKKGVKIVWSLHDYKIICPENSFVSNGKICEKCMTGNFYNCATNKCKKNSYSASFLAAVDAYFYHSTKTYDKVDMFLCPSEFILKKFKSFGFDESKLFLSHLCYNISLVDDFISNYHVLNKNNTDNSSIKRDDKYILYIGRVETIKGIKTLIDAVKGTDIKLKIVGSGTEIDNLVDYLKVEDIRNVEFMGFQNKDSVFSLTLNSKFVVCPSEWYENFPFSITESFLFSKPVVGANIGGIPELVRDGETGYLFEAGNAADLQEKLFKLWNDDLLAEQMGKNARDHAINIFNFDTHWDKLNTVFKNLNIHDN